MKLGNLDLVHMLITAGTRQQMEVKQKGSLSAHVTSFNFQNPCISQTGEAERISDFAILVV